MLTASDVETVFCFQATHQDLPGHDASDSDKINRNVRSPSTTATFIIVLSKLLKRITVQLRKALPRGFYGDDRKECTVQLHLLQFRSNRTDPYSREVRPFGATSWLHPVGLAQNRGFSEHEAR